MSVNTLGCADERSAFSIGLELNLSECLFFKDVS